MNWLKRWPPNGPYNNVDGLAFMDGGKTVVNPRRPLIKDLDLIPFPAYELFPMQFYRLLREPRCENVDFVMPMISGRGCPFRCAFCYRMDEGLRCPQHRRDCRRDKDA